MHCKDRAGKGVLQHQSVPGLTEDHGRELKTTSDNHVFVPTISECLSCSPSLFRGRKQSSHWGTILCWEMRSDLAAEEAWRADSVLALPDDLPQPVFSLTESPASAWIPTPSELHHSCTLLDFFLPWQETEYFFKMEYWELAAENTNKSLPYLYNPTSGLAPRKAVALSRDLYSLHQATKLCHKTRKNCKWQRLILPEPYEEFFCNPFPLQAGFGCVSQKKVSHQKLALFQSFFRLNGK